MNELEIKRHNFDLAKNRLKEFSEKTESDLRIDKVQEKGSFIGLLNHKVTGSELNERMMTVQNHFIAINSTNNKVIKEFKEIYNALDSLDKEYITSIVANVKAIEKTSNDVRVQQGTLKDHNEQLATQQSKLDAHQAEIDKTVINISKIVEKLKSFKESLESYSHLTDIDRIWNDCQTWQHDISALTVSLSDVIGETDKNTESITDIKECLESINKTISQLEEDLSAETVRLESVISFISELNTIVHLKDIDTIWKSLEDANTSLNNLHNELNETRQITKKHQQDIEQILKFVETVSKYEHLKDVDIMWDKVENDNKRLDNLTVQSNNTIESVKENQVAISGLIDYKHELSSIAHLKDVDNLWESSEKYSKQIEELQHQDEEMKNLIHSNKELVDQSLAAEKEKTDTALQQLNKKLQYAYWIAGGSMALALVELFFILLR